MQIPGTDKNVNEPGIPLVNLGFIQIKNLIPDKVLFDLNLEIDYHIKVKFETW